MKTKANYSLLFFAIGIPTTFAFTSYFAFTVLANLFSFLFSIMSITFLFLIPCAIGGLTVYFTNDEKAKSNVYRTFMPWVPILIFFFLTLILNIEGWACWLMILPVFLIAASVGGHIAGNVKMRRNKRKERINISVLVMLPFLLSPLEQLVGKIPGTYEAYTYMDIKAPKDKIWSNVTRVKAIPGAMDKGWLTNFLEFPRPVKAELNYEGVGAYREAIFDKGLVFHEQVKNYQHQKKMTFSIKAFPHDIPSTTMDEHIVIGGDYFDVLDGTYELERISENYYRLHLYSHFKLTTTFNFYASWWAKAIMKDIQNNILQVIKYRAENS